MSIFNFTKRQEEAEAAFAPVVNKKGQQQRIVEWLDKYGFITPLACIHAVPMITTKLSTRIGEIERKTGVEFKHDRMPDNRCMKYTCTPEDLETLKGYYHIES